MSEVEFKKRSFTGGTIKKDSILSYFIKTQLESKTRDIDRYVVSFIFLNNKKWVFYSFYFLLIN